MSLDRAAPDRSATLNGIGLALILAVYTYTPGVLTDAGEVNSSVQIAKLGIIALVSLLAIAQMLMSRSGITAFIFTFRSMLVLWVFMLLSAIMLPFSYQFGVSVNKFLISFIGMISLNLAILRYAPQMATFGREMLARHLLYIFGVFIALGVLSMVVWSGSGELRWQPTFGLIHPNIMASSIGLGCVHAILYGRISPMVQQSALIRLLRIFIITFGFYLIAILYSRGVIISLFAVFCILPFYFIRNKIFLLIVLSGMAILFIFIVSYSDEIVLNLLSRDASENVAELTGRNLIWEAVFSEMDAKNLLTGFGYAISFPSYSFFLGDGYVFGTHNTYLQSLTSGGIIGFCLFIYYALMSIFIPIRNALTGRNCSNLYNLCCAVFIFTHCFSESLFGVNVTSSFALFICTRLYNNVPERVANGNLHGRSAKLSRQWNNSPRPRAA